MSFRPPLPPLGLQLSGTSSSLRGVPGSFARPARSLRAVAFIAIGLFGALYVAGSAVTPSPATAPERSAFTHRGLASLPWSLRRGASSTIAADQPGFAVKSQRGALVGSGGGGATIFGPLGPRISASGGSESLTLSGVGHGTRLAALVSVRPVAYRDAASYDRGDVIESYSNGPLGLEQSFTLAHRPVGAAEGGLLTLRIGLSGSLVARANRARASCSPVRLPVRCCCATARCRQMTRPGTASGLGWCCAAGRCSSA